MSSKALASLISQYTDSEPESEVEDDGRAPDTPIEEDEDRKSNEEVAIETNSPRSPIAEENRLSPVSFHRSLFGVAVDDIVIPGPPSGQCPEELTEKVSMLCRKAMAGQDLNRNIQERKSFRNPSIYEKLVAFCDIDEFGTNYPPETYDPHDWQPTSYYEDLARQQKEEMDRHEKEKKEKSKVDFVTGTVKKATVSGSLEPKRKSKWDEGPSAKSTTSRK
ncbi:SAP30-binding protein [Halotydeus destructor]|nr:SAP30-binding protein [Halotydeus destructor]